MSAQVTARLFLFSVLLLASMVLIASPASASIPVRGTGSYGSLTSQQIGAPTIGGTGASILSDALYQCQNGTGCPIDLNIPGTSNACSTAFSDSPSGSPVSCFDLLVVINPGTTFTPGSTLSITIPGFSDPNGDEFGLVTCLSGPTQDFAGFCTSAVPAGCDTATSSISGGTVNIPTACLVQGVTFYFDETANNIPVTSAFVAGPATSAPEPTTFMLLAFGLVTLALFSKQLQRA